jgi:hypothetical protein
MLIMCLADCLTSGLTSGLDTPAERPTIELGGPGHQNSELDGRSHVLLVDKRFTIKLQPVFKEYVNTNGKRFMRAATNADSFPPPSRRELILLDVAFCA